MKLELLLDRLAAPARRALTNAGIETIEGLTKHTEEEVLQLHGIGKNAMAIIKETLREKGLDFKAVK